MLRKAAKALGSIAGEVLIVEAEVLRQASPRLLATALPLGIPDGVETIAYAGSNPLDSSLGNDGVASF